VALAATAAFAQSGGITVVVTDDGGLALPGATVTIGHETGYVKTTAQLTGGDGVAEFPVLRPGTGFFIEVAFPGFNTIREDGLRVNVNTKLTLPVQMIKDLAERVTVTATSEVVSLDTTRQSTKFGENFIADLPVAGRFYQNVLTMAPGVQDADGDGNPNVHGSRSRDFQAIVSGVSNVDPLTGQWMSRINPNSIEEMEVITAGAGVEFGRAQGGFARIIQKQGSNRHEGVAEYYYRTSELDGTGAFDGSGIEEAEFDWHQPALQFTGPLIRDKLWYRVSLEHRDIDEPVNVTSGIEITAIEDKTNDFQLTWQVSPRNKLALQYRQDPRRITNLGVSSLVDSRSSYGIDRETQTTTMIWTAPYSPKVLVEGTVAWQDQNLSIFPTTADLPNSCVVGLDFLQRARCTSEENGRVTGSFNTDVDDHRQRLTVDGKATVYGGHFWGMDHQFKLGLRSENERYFRDLTQGPSMIYSIQRDPGSFEEYGLAVVDLSVPESDDVRATGTNWAIYAEDQFRPRQNLTVTLGGRIDREEIHSEGRELFDPAAELDEFLSTTEPLRDPTSPGYNPDAVTILRIQTMNRVFTGYEDFASFQNLTAALICGEAEPLCKNQVFTAIETLANTQKTLDHKREIADVNIGNTNFSPFLSVAWDPFSDGKTAIKASAGRHYNNIPLLIPLRGLEPAEAGLTYQVDLSNGNAYLLDGISPSVNVTMLDSELNTPYQDELTFSVERELWPETSIGVTYISRKFRDQLQDRNINIATGDYGRCVLQENPIEPTLVESWGTGEVWDPFADGLYEDTDPGPGDGRVDDCSGEEVADPSWGYTLERPDDILDLYKLNPFWGDVFVIGNFNEVDYEAWVVELVRRQYRSWELQASYTYSEAEGDGEDFNSTFDNDPSVVADDIFGYQSYDQRHVVKLNATTITPWGIRLGTALSWQSGLPYSIIFRQTAFDNLPPETQTLSIVGARSRSVYPTGVRNDQRNQSYWNLDLKFTKEFSLSHRMNLQLSAEVFNVLNDGTYQIYTPDLERGAQINGTNEAFRRFGRQWQLGAKLAF